MPRLPADFRISLKRRGVKTYRIELIRNPFNQRFWVRRNGKRSRKLPEATATEIADQIRRADADGVRPAVAGLIVDRGRRTGSRQLVAVTSPKPCLP